MNNPAAAVRPKSSRPTGPLPEALRAWADHIYISARLAVKARSPMAPQLVAGTDMTDWRSHMSPREWAVLSECMKAGIWGPEED